MTNCPYISCPFLILHLTCEKFCIMSESCLCLNHVLKKYLHWSHTLMKATWLVHGVDNSRHCGRCRDSSILLLRRRHQSEFERKGKRIPLLALVFWVRMEIQILRRTSIQRHRRWYWVDVPKSISLWTQIFFFVFRPGKKLRSIFLISYNTIYLSWIQS